jgi:spore coat polysaccharide biosynthesis protein SpsF
MRCLALAEELRAEHDIVSGFALRSDDTGIKLIERCDYPVYVPTEVRSFHYKKWLNEVIQKTSARTLVLDIRDDLPVSMLTQLRQLDTLLVTIDDSSNRRLQVDLAFYPPVPQVGRLDWTGFTGQLYVGWEWIPLRREIPGLASRNQHDKLKTLLLTTGGADPEGMAPRIVQFLSRIEQPYDVVVVAGPAFHHREKLESAIESTSANFRIETNPSHLPSLMAKTDVAITAFGVTAYELAALGVPSLYLCLTRDHEESASALADQGAGISLGLFSELKREVFYQALTPLLESSTLRSQMSLHGRKAVDGKGAKRIAELIVGQMGNGTRNE